MIFENFGCGTLIAKDISKCSCRNGVLGIPPAQVTTRPYLYHNRAKTNSTTSLIFCTRFKTSYLRLWYQCWHGDAKHKQDDNYR